MYSPLSSRSSSRSSSFSDLSRSDEPCQVTFTMGETVWARVGTNWQVGLVVSSEYQKSFAPYHPLVRTWDVVVLSNGHADGFFRTSMAPALGHIKPANDVVLGLLHAEGLIPSAWFYGAQEIDCQVRELRKRLANAGVHV